MGIVAHYVAADGTLQDLPIALPQLTGAHSSERIAEVVVTTLQAFEIATLASTKLALCGKYL